jgi:hypothetical protein
MSKWAESLDRQIFENDILFILPTGNINSRSYNRTVPGIKDYLEEGKNYPDYLFDHRSRVANPSHSLFSLTVGSVCHSDYENDDVVSFGKTGHPSAFTRTGLGIWGSIKPEVVEFGGDFAKNKSESDNTLYEPDDISISVVRSTLSAGPAVGKGNGTSFAAPKVTSIVGTLQKLFPDESTLLYKALIIQSARWPAHIFSNPHPELDLIRAFWLRNSKLGTSNYQQRL